MISLGVVLAQEPKENADPMNGLFFSLTEGNTATGFVSHFPRSKPPPTSTFLIPISDKVNAHMYTI